MSPDLGGRRCRRHFPPLDVAEHLRMAQEPAEVDVEHVASGLEHDVVIVPVADPQHVGGHAAAGAGIDEVFHSLGGGREGATRHGERLDLWGLVPGGGRKEQGRCRAPPHLLVLVLFGVVFLQPVGQRPVFEGACHAVLHLDLAQGLGVGDHLHHAWQPRQQRETPRDTETPAPICHQPRHHHRVTACTATFLRTGWWGQTRGQITAPHHSPGASCAVTSPRAPCPEAGGHPDARSPRPRPVEKQRKMTMRMSSPSCTQILFMMRIICSVSMSCRRSSPHCEPAGKSRQSPGTAGTKPSQLCVGWGSRAGVWAPPGGRAHLEDNSDVFPEGIDVLEGELQRDGVGVEVGAVLPWEEGAARQGELAGAEEPPDTPRLQHSPAARSPSPAGWG